MRRLRKRSRTGAASSRTSASAPTGPPPRWPRGVGDDGPHVLAERGAEQHQVAVLGLAQDPARRARDRAGAPVAAAASTCGRRSSAHEARERLARQRPGERAARRRPVVTSSAPRAAARRRATQRARRASSAATSRPPSTRRAAELERRRQLAAAARACARCETSAQPTRVAARSPRPRRTTATFQPSRTSKRAPAARAWRSIGRARDRVAAAGATRNSKLMSAAPPPRGRRTAASSRSPRSVAPSSEIVIVGAVGGERGGHPGHADHLAELAASGATLVTWPTGPPSAASTTAPSVGTCPSAIVKPTSAVSAGVLGGVLERPAADEVLLLVELDDPRHRGAVGRRLRVGVLADDHVQLLQAQDALRLEPERPRAPAADQRVPHVLAVGGREVDLVADLADEADPQEQRVDAGDLRALARRGR